MSDAELSIKPRWWVYRSLIYTEGQAAVRKGHWGPCRGSGATLRERVRQTCRQKVKPAVTAGAGKSTCVEDLDISATHPAWCTMKFL